ncbi:MAG: sigma-70 family RNA polymerase sigma factor [Acidobacteriota bacterium]|nr:sigma-70 family RNA polymerase sigma factor [Acidobacteriota bacterium]
MELFPFDDPYVRRLREGDRETAEHFHAYFRDLLYAKLRRRLRSSAAIEDVRQEVFARVLQRLDTLHDPRKLGAFVNATCHNVLMEFYRQDSRAVALEEQGDVTDAVDLDATYDSIRNSARVRRVLATLDEREQAILQAVFIDEGDKEEVCARFGVDRQYLRVLLHRAKAKFRTAYLRRKSGRLSIDETFPGHSSLHE